jgi:hypothetical protein
MFGFARLVALVTAVLSTVSILAIDVRPTAGTLDAKVLAVAPVRPNVDPVAVNTYLSSLTWTAWNAANGGRWVAQYDTLTGHPRRVYGGAMPWVPGPANNLTGSATSADLERVARQFIAANQSVIGVANANLIFVEQPATPTRSGRVRYAVFDYAIDGVPVENGRLLFAVNNGNMIYWHSVNMAKVAAVTTPAITADQAINNVFTYAGIANAAVVQQPTLKLLPRNAATGTLLTYQLVYQTAIRVDGSEGTWAAYVDALTGAVIAFADANHYLEGQGRVRGGVRPAKANDAEVVRSFPLAAVENSLGNTATSANGVFAFRGGRSSTSLSGTFFDANCVACPSQASATSMNGRLDLGVGGADHVGNGVSTPAERTGFFHTNVARLIANKWLDLSWLRDDEIALNVNIAATCNAYYSSNTLNFYRAGNGCANTGEIRDVMQHEWGHGLDDHDGDRPGYEAALGLGDMATGEAVGDHIALFVDHDPCIGQSFQNGRNTGIYTVDPFTNEIATCDGVRNLDEHRVLRGNANTRPVVSGLLTLSNVSAKCPGPPVVPAQPLYAAYIGPMAREGHCEGEIWGQAAVHLAYTLSTGKSFGSAKYDANQQHLTYAGDAIGDSAVDGSKNPGFDRDQAWTIAERLFFESRPMVASYAPSTVQAMGPSAYDGYLVVDDTGDGLLPNGTPNAAYINDAFIHHEIHETGISTASKRLTSVDTKDCAAPATPNVTLTQGIVSGTQAVTISWAAVAGAESYTVLRNERRDDVFLEVARVLGNGTTSVVDAGVDNGVTYNYRVQANAGGTCFAVSAGGVKSITIAQPDALVRRVNVDDALKGNNDGQLDAGEKTQLTVVLGNDGLAGLSNVSASLTSSTAGVTVTKGGPRTFGAIAAGGEAFSSSAYEVVLDPNGALCGADAVLLFSVSASQGSFTLPVTLPIGESGPNCTVVGRAHAQPLSVSIVSDAAGSCGDGDLVPDPGETVRVDVVVNNIGDATARNVNVTLQSSASYLTVTPASVTLDSIAPLGADVRTATFLVTVGAAPHGDVATLTASVTSSGRTVASTRSMTTPVNRDLLVQTFDYDFESGAQGWTASDAAGWHLTNTALTTGNSTWVWHSNYGALKCELLTSPDYEFSTSSSLTFDVAVLTEEAFDGVNVQVSVDGGQTWITAPSSYNFQAEGSGCMAAGEGLFSGNEPTMKRVTADLSQFAGYRGKVRFKFSGDDLLDYPVAGGAWIDNVSAASMIVSVPSAGCR